MYVLLLWAWYLARSFELNEERLPTRNEEQAVRPTSLTAPVELESEDP